MKIDIILAGVGGQGILSIATIVGAADAGMRPCVSVICDSNFTHSGMTSLLDCIY